MHELKVDFVRNDTILFLKQALFVSKQIEISEQEAKTIAEELYIYSKGDPLMFFFALINYIIREEKADVNFIERDINEKINSLPEENVTLWRAAILCIFMGTFGFQIRGDVMRYYRTPS